jgi:hypothetical protein
MSDRPTDREITRAQRLARLAVRAGRPLADACPYDANGSAKERILTARYVQAYVAAGGTVDGLEYDDGVEHENGAGE